MEELLPKKYRIEIEFFGRFKKSKTIYFDYEQGSLRDLIEMKSKIDNAEELNKWLFNFLMKKTKQSDKLTMRLFSQLCTSHRLDIIQHLLKTYAKGYFKVTDVETIIHDKTPSSSLICFLLEYTNETLESLLDMTWERINYLTDGITWNKNEETKVGKERNRRKMRMIALNEEFTGDDTDAKIKRLDEKMKAKKLKK
ncbi:MAG: hypothetical protein V4549_03690 [Bacteroidota bacterium]